MPVIPAVWEADVGGWITKSGDQDHPGQHGETSSLPKIKKELGMAAHACRGGGCSELRLPYCTLAWVTERDLSQKQTNKNPWRTRCQENISLMFTVICPDLSKHHVLSPGPTSHIARSLLTVLDLDTTAHHLESLEYNQASPEAEEVGCCNQKLCKGDTLRLMGQMTLQMAAHGD
ncbi:hypothetical protein AAY473_020192, partial [Plecturocebus cupreus]